MDLRHDFVLRAKDPLRNMAELFRAFDITVEAIEAPHRLSFRWHPAAMDEQKDYSNEPTTLVEFVLSEPPGGTLVVED